MSIFRHGCTPILNELILVRLAEYTRFSRSTQVLFFVRKGLAHSGSPLSHKKLDWCTTLESVLTSPDQKSSLSIYRTTRVCSLLHLNRFFVEWAWSERTAMCVDYIYQSRLVFVFVLYLFNHALLEMR